MENSPPKESCSVVPSPKKSLPEENSGISETTKIESQLPSNEPNTIPRRPTTRKTYNDDEWYDYVLGDEGKERNGNKSVKRVKLAAKSGDRENSCGNGSDGTGAEGSRSFVTRKERIQMTISSKPPEKNGTLKEKSDGDDDAHVKQVKQTVRSGDRERNNGNGSGGSGEEGMRSSGLRRSCGNSPEKDNKIRNKDGDAESSMCHQCQRNDKGGVVHCAGCKKNDRLRRYCFPCIARWYPEKTRADFEVECPVCLGNCNCKACMRDVQAKKTPKGKIDKNVKLNMLQYLLYKALPVVKHIHDEQRSELEVESLIQGVTVTDAHIDRIELSKNERLYCVPAIENEQVAVLDLTSVEDPMREKIYDKFDHRDRCLYDDLD